MKFDEKLTEIFNVKVYKPNKMLLSHCDSLKTDFQNIGCFDTFFMKL